MCDLSAQQAYMEEKYGPGEPDDDAVLNWIDKTMQKQERDA